MRESEALTELLGRAVHCHQQGDSELAKRLYRAVLAKYPSQFDALHYLGLLEAQNGDINEALRLLQQAVAIKPEAEAAQVNLGNVLLELGKMEDALRCVNHALAMNPNSPVTLNCQGLILLESRRPFDALSAFDEALRQAPDYVEAMSNRGNALLQLGRAEEALSSYGQALQINPDAVEVLNNQGNALLELRRYREAVAIFDRALQRWPDYAEALHHRGTAHYELKNQQVALADIERALQLNPRYPEALNSYGNVLERAGRYEEALSAFDAALGLWPDFVDALSNRGNVLAKLHRDEEALASCEKALALDPRHVSALNNKANVIMHLGAVGDALRLYENALKLDPHSSMVLANRGNALMALERGGEALLSYESALGIDAANEVALNGRAQILHMQKKYVEAAQAFDQLLVAARDYPYAVGHLVHSKLCCCDWSEYELGIERIVTAVRAGRRVASPFMFLSVSDSPEDQLQGARALISHEHPPKQVRRIAGPPRPSGKLRLAYLSADFKNHPVGVLVAPLIERHNRERFEVFGISFGGDAKGEQRLRLQKAFDHFVDVSEMSDPAVAALLQELGIDIAIDLMGHTAHSRMGIWACHPVPVQVNYLGFAGTTGADYFDYIVADQYVIPEKSQGAYTEKVVYLPGTFMPQEAGVAPVTRPSVRADYALPDTGFVFCGFNNHYKISPVVFDVWMRLLNQTEGSVLWLAKGTVESENNLRIEAGKRGVASERLVFASYTAKLEDHLERHHLADLFLDTFPFNAHSTASNALRAGLPVITCAGEAFASRVAGSLLCAAGLPELITSSLAEYEALALRLTKEDGLLASYKDRLSHNFKTLPVLKIENYCRHLELAYMAMWEKATVSTLAG